MKIEGSLNSSIPSFVNQANKDPYDLELDSLNVNSHSGPETQTPSFASCGNTPCCVSATCGCWKTASCNAMC